MRNFIILGLVFAIFTAGCKSNQESKSSTKNIENLSSSCVEKEEPNEGNENPILIKTCTFSKYQSIRKGYLDSKGRYSYQYQLFVKNDKNEWIEVKNDVIFNDKKDKLLSEINNKIKIEFENFMKDPNSVDCFKDFSLFPFDFNQLGIDFDGQKFNFNVTFGLPEYCKAFEGAIISYNFGEMQTYLKD